MQSKTVSNWKAGKEGHVGDCLVCFLERWCLEIKCLTTCFGCTTLVLCVGLKKVKRLLVCLFVCLLMQFVCLFMQFVCLFVCALFCLLVCVYLFVCLCSSCVQFFYTFFLFLYIIYLFACVVCLFVQVVCEICWFHVGACCSYFGPTEVLVD